MGSGFLGILVLAGQPDSPSEPVGVVCLLLIGSSHSALFTIPTQSVLGRMGSEMCVTTRVNTHGYRQSSLRDAYSRLRRGRTETAFKVQRRQVDLRAAGDNLQDSSSPLLVHVERFADRAAHGARILSQRARSYPTLQPAPRGFDRCDPLFERTTVPQGGAETHGDSKQPQYFQEPHLVIELIDHVDLTTLHSTRRGAGRSACD